MDFLIELILAASSVVEKFGELEKIIKKDGIKISKKLYTIIEGDRPVTMAKTTAIEISELSNVFENNNFESFLKKFNEMNYNKNLQPFILNGLKVSKKFTL